MSEDFGYMIERQRHDSSIFRKPLKVIIVLFSVASFVLITLSAYYFSSNEKDKSVELVKAVPKEQMKSRDNKNSIKIKNIDKDIYNNIVGNSSDDIATNKVRIIKEPKSVKPVELVEKNLSNLGSKNNDREIKQETKQEKLTVVEEIKKPYSRVQLAALKSEDSAYKYWLSLKKQYPKLFVNLRYFINKADLGSRGIFYRLQVGNFRNQIKAEEFCMKFITSSKKRRSDCIMVE